MDMAYSFALRGLLAEILGTLLAGYAAFFLPAHAATSDNSSAIGRLVHRSVVIELNLPSYRLQTAKRAVQKANPFD
ncbi:MAG TPA: hypothetical protein ENJ50_08440 [Planctomycetaceae bacterium]|nr:hypothetical protein [Planctomycetaceae bacterium]